MTDYNGWTNRNTWLINLWFGEMIREQLEEDAATSTEMLEGIIMDIIYEEIKLCSLMLRDFVDFDGINWGEIWEHHCLEVFYGEAS